VSFANAQIDGQTVPIILAGTRAQVSPPTLSGHPLEADNQIVLGAATLAQLHKHVGDTVIASYGTPRDAPVYVPSTRLVIVGTTTLPPSGARRLCTPPWVPERSSPPGSSRPRSRSSSAAVLLAAGLAVGAVAALGLTLTASVRRRRRDLALLKALGFTRRQLAACVAWQPTVAATIGIIAGIPLGIALGRWLWVLFAHQIYAVPRPTVPALLLACIGLGALVLANVAAALPGRYAARTPTALVLRTE
jgi:hypothetical protein